jgi:uncharacterized protein YaaQ
MNIPQVDRLAILTVSGTQVDALFAHLAREKFTFTVMNSRGGILQEPELCLLVGFQRDRLPLFLSIIRKECQPYRKYVPAQGFMQGEMPNSSMLEVEMGGARFYLMNVERFEQL